jgi:hypothetical protein
MRQVLNIFINFLEDKLNLMANRKMFKFFVLKMLKRILKILFNGQK